MLCALCVMLPGFAAGFALTPATTSEHMHKATAARLCVQAGADTNGADTWCSSRCSVGELQQKHLLASNLRRAPEPDNWVPRGFFLPHSRISAAGDALAAAVAAVYNPASRFSVEEGELETHFVVSQAAAELLRSTDLSDDTAAQIARTSLQICEDYLITRTVSPPLRRQLLNLASSRSTSCYGVKDQRATPGNALLQEQAARVLHALRMQAPELQISLLDRNVWIVKPVTGSMGRGIRFLRLEDLTFGCEKAPALGTCSHPDKEGLGYLVQRYVERPHLLRPRRLAALCTDSQGGHADGSETDSSHKYNLRFWIEVLWSDSRPEAWLYDEGYVELAAVPFTHDLGESARWAHVTNLSPAGGDGQVCIECRQWSTQIYRMCLGNSSQFQERQLADDLLVRAGTLCARALSTIRFSSRSSVTAAEDAEGGRGDQRGNENATQGGSADRWKRFGVDLLVDANCDLWLIGACSERGNVARKRGVL